MNLQMISLSGKISQLEVSDVLFAGPVNSTLIAQAVRVYLANQRVAKAKTKTRAEVSYTKAKWFRQKGTGRARHGAQTPNIFVGGGVSHGPTGKENYKLRLSKQMRTVAIKSALCARVEQTMVLEGSEALTGKTKELNAFLKILSPSNERTLIVVAEPSQELLRSAKNIQRAMVTQASRLNVYELMLAEKVLFTKDALTALEGRLLNSVTVEEDEIASVVEENKVKKVAIKKSTAASKATKKEVSTSKTARAKKAVTRSVKEKDSKE